MSETTQSPSTSESPEDLARKGYDAITSLAQQPVETLSQPIEPRHHIVGIGASAGGLDAIERFFDHVPLDSGLSFVLVQHLSPDFKSLMDELLARRTKLLIHRVENGMPIERNAIYLIPPNMNMVLSDNRLWLTRQEHKAILNLPIDVFFRSLAKDAGDRAIGVILSGTGSDGSRGVCDIYENGGLVVVQDPETASFDGMPRTAIASGSAHVIAPPEKMPGKIIRYTHNPASLGDEEGADVDDDDAMSALFSLLRRTFGVDFTHYKPGTIARRLERRMSLNSLTNLKDYIALVERNPAEIETLHRDLLVEVTQFFRDQPAFDVIRNEVIPRLFEQADRDEGIRVWVPGCATGEEAYSLGILLHSYREAAKLSVDIKIFATDVHRTSLEIAASGEFSEESLLDLPSIYLDRYFLRRRNKYVVNPDLRKLILFAPQNLTKDPPFTKLDLISCRNVLIYLNAQSQRKILTLFQFGLKVGGYLMLGPSESLPDPEHDFEAIDTHWKIFRKQRELRTSGHDRMSIFQPISTTAQDVNQKLFGGLPRSELNVPAAYEALLASFVPAGLLVDSNHNLLHIFGNASKFLKMPEGKTTNDILRMVDEDLRISISSALHRAAKERVEVAYKSIRSRTPAGDMRLRVSAVPLVAGPAKSLLFLVRLEEETLAEAPRKLAESFDAQGEAVGRIHELEQELVYTKEHLQTTIEELETSNEELQSTNEELVASNEELQSTNEELHSVNEELYTVNAEYQKKIEELMLLTNDMDNLLGCTDIGTIFLDIDLHIRKFTPSIAHVFNLLPQDVGRPLKHISINLKLEHHALVRLVEQMLEEGRSLEHEVVGPHNQTFLMRILPYHTQKGVTEGVVLTFVDISAIKETQRRLETNERRMHLAMEAGEVCTWEWRVKEDRFQGGGQFSNFFGLANQPFEGNLEKFLDLSLESDRPSLREAMQGSLETAQRVETEFRAPGPAAEARYLVIRADVDRDEQGKAVRLLGVCIDATKQRVATKQLRESQELLRAVLDNSSALIFAKDIEGRFLFVNQSMVTKFGLQKQEVLGKLDADLFEPELARTNWARDRQVISTGEVLQFEETRERLDGPHSLLTTKFPLRDGEGRIRGVGAISTDITQLKQAESEVRSALLRRDTFLAMLSHELRNPLGTILNATYVLQDDGTSQESRKESVAILQRQGEQMSRLLDDLLDVSRVTQNKIQIKVEDVDLLEVIKEAILVCQQEFERADMTLDCRHECQSLFVRGDSVRLQQVMVNLLKNAVKYTAPGGLVRLETRQLNELAEVRVIDNGIGIEPDMLDRVFDLFVQADPGLDRSDAGMGVGLTLAQSIIEQHDGSIEAQSEGAGKGSTFVVGLPVRKQAESQLIEPQVQEAMATPGSLRVVIVEDNHDSRRMLETLLRLEGCAVEVAGTGPHGLETILRTKPDLALVDIGLPLMNGYEVAELVRNSPDGGDIQLVALTGYGRTEDQQRVIAAGFNDHLVKPLRRESLMQVLGRSRKEKE